MLKELIDAGNRYDAVIAIGPMIMMKFVCETTRPYGIKTIVSMNATMGRHRYVRLLPLNRWRRNKVCMRRRP